MELPCDPIAGSGRGGLAACANSLALDFFGGGCSSLMLVHIHLHFLGLSGSAPRDGPGCPDGGVSLLSTAAPMGAAIAGISIAGVTCPCSAAAVRLVGSMGS